MPFPTHSPPRTRLAPATLLAVFFAALGCRGVEPTRGVILISVDSLRPDHLGCYGHTLPTSPRLDALAETAVVFDDVHSHAPSTLPSHASLLTSLLPQQHGAAFAGRTPLADEITTLAEVLRGAGVRTAAYTGSAQMSRNFGLGQGFEIYEHRNRPLAVNAARAADWRASIGGDRFFLFLHTYEVHHPYDATEPEMAALGVEYHGTLPRQIPLRVLKQANRHPESLSAEDAAYIEHAYDAGIRRMDSGLGLLIDGLRQEGLFDRVMIVVTSDHGEEFREHGWIGWHAHSLYEELLRVPLVVRLPGGASGGERVARAVRLIDVAPTILDYLGVPAPPEFAGTSLRQAIDGRLTEALPTVALQDTEERDLEALRIGSWKLASGRLFDLESDPGEKRDLAAERPQVAAEMARRLRAMVDEREAHDGGEAAIDAETEEELRALGYVQ